MIHIQIAFCLKSVRVHEQTPIGILARLVNASRVCCVGGAASTMSILEQGFTGTGVYQLQALRVRNFPTLARFFYALRAVLGASDDFPLDAEEHPHPSSDKLGDFDPEDEERAFSLRLRVQVTRQLDAPCEAEDQVDKQGKRVYWKRI